MASAFSVRLGMSIADRGTLCVGIDPSGSLLAQWGLDDDATGAERLSRLTIDAIADVAGIVKVQVAFFERHGAQGYVALEHVLAHARDAGLLVIGDAKRGDIFTTNLAYADAWLAEGSPLGVDALTVSCYLGVGAMAEVFELAHRNGRGVFVVVASSNEEGRGVQTARLEDGRTVEGGMLEALGSANRQLDGAGPPTRCVGAVVGATRRPDGLGTFLGPVLVPGIGAQGASAGSVRELRETLCHSLVAVNVSRAILEAGPAASAIRDAATGFVEALG